MENFIKNEKIRKQVKSDAIYVIDEINKDRDLEFGNDDHHTFSNKTVKINRYHKSTYVKYQTYSTDPLRKIYDELDKDLNIHRNMSKQDSINVFTKGIEEFVGKLDGSLDIDAFKKQSYENTKKYLKALSELRKEYQNLPISREAVSKSFYIAYNTADSQKEYDTECVLVLSKTGDFNLREVNNTKNKYFGEYEYINEIFVISDEFVKAVEDFKEIVKKRLTK